MINNMCEKIKIYDSKRYDSLKLGCSYKETSRLVSNNGVSWIEFPFFDRFCWLKTVFSTRIGGVSRGIYESMNFSFDRGDDRSNVINNYKLFTDAVGINFETLVCSKQTHTTNVMAVNKDRCGMGITKERDYDNIDGLMTDESQVTLVTSFADCVPVFFVDHENKCIASSHSGWRGTVNNITEKTLAAMHDKYGTKPQNVYSFVGPCICMDCYEVSFDVAEQFIHSYSSEQCDNILYKKDNGKYQLDLKIANYYNMVNAGIPSENIGIADICTCCNPKLLYSHRASNGQRGVLNAFMYIK